MIDPLDEDGPATAEGRADQADWLAARSFADLGELGARFLEGRLAFFPGWMAPDVDEETDPLVPLLAGLCRGGFLTVASQPAGASNTTHDGRPWRRRAFVSGFCDEEAWARLKDLEADGLIVTGFRADEAREAAGLPVGEMGGEAYLFAGTAAGPEELELFQGQLAPEALEALHRARYVSVIEPQWGRDDRLWRALSGTLRGRYNPNSRWARWTRMGRRTPPVPSPTSIRRAMSDQESRPNPIFAWLAIVLAAGWLGVGAYYKLTYASPNALPPIYKDLTDSWFGWTATEAYRWAVTVEFVVVAMALIRPRTGWKVLALQYLVFLLILAQLQLTGVTSCGCFGSKVNVKPLEMMAIDAPLLLLLLISRPWKRLPKARFSPLPWAAIALVGVAGLWAPRHYMPTDEDHHPWWSFWSTFGDSPAPTVASGNGGDTRPEPGPAVNTEDEDPAQADNPPDQVPDPQPADDLPVFVPLDPTGWVGQMLADTKVGTYLTVDPYEVPDTAHVILYRRSCDHCKDHLNQLAINPITDRPVVLIELRADGDEQLENLIEARPAGAFEFELKSIERGYGLETPWSLELEGWTVTSVENTREAMGG